MKTATHNFQQENRSRETHSVGYYVSQWTQPKPTELTEVRRLPPEQQALRDTFTHGSILDTYGPKAQSKLLRINPPLGEIAQNDRIPTLGMVAQAFGITTAKDFVALLVESLNVYAGQSAGLTDYQIEELSALLMTEYSWLNLAEFHVFFIRFKAGHYGTFYGTVDPIKIGNAFQTFIKERWQEIDAYEQQQRKRQQQINIEERSRNATTYQEYQELLQRAKDGDPEAQAQLPQYLWQAP